MSPTILKIGRYGSFFTRREEMRRHLHVSCPEGTAKFWFKPIISLASYYRLPPRKFVQSRRALNAVPPVAQYHPGRASAKDGRTTRHHGFAVSQRLHKKMEEIFDSMQTAEPQVREDTCATGAADPPALPQDPLQQSHIQGCKT